MRLFFFVFGFFLAGHAQAQSAPAEIETEESAFSKLDFDRMYSLSDIIANRYVDEIKPGAHFQSALRVMIGSLDSHSFYMTPETYRRFSGLGDGSVTSSGVRLAPRPRGYNQEVSFSFPGSPADEAGIQAGDIIVNVDGKNVNAMATDEIELAMAGEPEAVSTVNLVRSYGKKPVSGERDRRRRERIVSKIQHRPYQAKTFTARLLDGDVGYIAVVTLEERHREAHGATMPSTNDTDALVSEAIAALSARGATKFILDLRLANGASVGDVINRTAALFLPKGSNAAIAKFRGAEKGRFVAAEDGPFAGIPLAVLIGPGTRSGGEALAGALRGRASLVGQKTAGEGTIQNILALPDGSAVWMTVGRIFTALGEPIDVQDGGGIVPDVPAAISSESAASSERDILNDANGGGSIQLSDPAIAEALNRL